MKHVSSFTFEIIYLYIERSWQPNNETFLSTLTSNSIQHWNLLNHHNWASSAWTFRLLCANFPKLQLQSWMHGVGVGGSGKLDKGAIPPGLKQICERKDGHQTHLSGFLVKRDDKKEHLIEKIRVLTCFLSGYSSQNSLSPWKKIKSR